MSKILAVFGATGQQGGSVVTRILSDPELSSRYTIRAITRDTTSPKATSLSKHEGVQVVAADISDRASIVQALTGVHTVFIVNPPSFGLTNFEIELNNTKAMVDVAVEVGVEYIIYSTLPSVSENSGGKYTKVFLFDAKAEAEKYIRSLPVQSAFVSLGGFMENFHSPVSMIRKKGEDGSLILARNDSPTARFPLLAATEDTGKFVAGILAEPENFVGRRIEAAGELMNWEEAAKVMTKVLGRKVVYQQDHHEEFSRFLPPAIAAIFVEVYLYSEEFGYFGRDTEQLVAEGKKVVRGKLTSFEEWLRAHPLKLD